MTGDEEVAARDFLSGCVLIDIGPDVWEKAILIRRFSLNFFQFFIHHQSLPNCPAPNRQFTT
jgi:hypothetical protein